MHTLFSKFFIDFILKYSIFAVIILDILYTYQTYTINEAITVLGELDGIGCRYPP